MEFLLSNFRTSVWKEAFIITVITTSVISNVQINRIQKRTAIDGARRNIFDSYDYFANPAKNSFCSQKNSFCKASDCSECLCNFGLTFHSVEKGCVSLKELNKKQENSLDSVGQGCEFSFYYQQKSVVPMIELINSWVITSIRLKLNRKDLNLSDPDLECYAGAIYEVTANGSKLIDNNIDSSLFKIQAGMNTRKLYSKGWNSMKRAEVEGKLLKLQIKCTKDALFVDIELDSCILFKVNGTSPAKTTTTTTSVTPPTKKSSTAAKRATSKSGNLPTAKTTTVAPPNATLAILDTRKAASVSAGAIVGGIIGLIILLVLIGLVLFYLRRRKRRGARSSSPTNEEILKKGPKENGNDISYNASGGIPLFSMNQGKNEDLENREETNPYYASGDDQSKPDYTPGNEAENLYYRPADLPIVPKPSKADETGDVYYSSADVVKKSPNGAESGRDQAKHPQLVQEYSYARADSPCTPVKDPDSHYKALEDPQYQPGMYQSLENPIGKRPDPANKEGVNPYYTPAKPAKLKPNTNKDLDAEKCLSLQNNAGSRENVYQVPEIENTESHYQGLTMQNQSPPEYAPLSVACDDEYLDMSGTSQNDYVEPGEIKI